MQTCVSDLYGKASNFPNFHYALIMWQQLGDYFLALSIASTLKVNVIVSLQEKNNYFSKLKICMLFTQETLFLSTNDVNRNQIFRKQRNTFPIPEG